MTTARESNAIILRKGRTTLLSAKIMLIALLNVENRNGDVSSMKDSQYYNRLLRSTGVDYNKGLVSEIAVADLKKLLNKSKSGSFYTAIKELFSDTQSPKSLRNSWAVMMPNEESGVLGYAEIITSCHYDTTSGKLFLKFNNEPYIFKQLWKIQEDYTELPLKYMLSLKTVGAYRLVEILTQSVSSTEEVLISKGETPSGEYSFQFTLGELQLMLGIIDITTDTIGKKNIMTRHPDYNAIVEDVNERQRESMATYANFRRYSLDVAVTEINTNDASPFTVDYDVEREHGSRKITSIIFFVRRRNNKQKVQIDESKSKHMDFIIDLTREMSEFSLSYSELCKIATAADYDKELIVAAKFMYQKLCIKDNFAEWFYELRK